MCVQDICIYGDPTKSYVVALVCPARAAISAMAARFGKSELSFEQLCGDKDITGGVLRDIVIQVTGLAAATTTIKEFYMKFTSSQGLFFCLGPVPPQISRRRRRRDIWGGTGPRQKNSPRLEVNFILIP